MILNYFFISRLLRWQSKTRICFFQLFAFFYFGQVFKYVVLFVQVMQSVGQTVLVQMLIIIWIDTIMFELLVHILVELVQMFFIFVWISEIVVTEAFILFIFVK